MKLQRGKTFNFTHAYFVGLIINSHKHSHSPGTDIHMNKVINYNNNFVEIRSFKDYTRNEKLHIHSSFLAPNCYSTKPVKKEKKISCIHVSFHSLLNKQHQNQRESRLF